MMLHLSVLVHLTGWKITLRIGVANYRENFMRKVENYLENLHSLGIEACSQRKRVLFASATGLLDQLVDTSVSRTIQKTLDLLGRLDLGELGYMPIDSQRGNLFFQVVSRRYEKGSIILNTNQSFDH